MVERVLIVKNEFFDITEIKNYLKINSNAFECTLTNTLHNLGVPSNLKGYHFLKKAIVLLYQNENLLIKEIYEIVARETLTTTYCVESNIRHAIEVAWLRGDYEVINNIFGSTISFERNKPTNSEFISTIVDVLRISKIC